MLLRNIVAAWAKWAAGWFVYVPKTYRPNHPVPLVLMLHGAGGDVNGAMKILCHLADPFQYLLNEKYWAAFVANKFGYTAGLLLLAVIGLEALAVFCSSYPKLNNSKHR